MERWGRGESFLCSKLRAIGLGSEREGEDVLEAAKYLNRNAFVEMRLEKKLVGSTASVGQEKCGDVSIEWTSDVDRGLMMVAQLLGKPILVFGGMHAVRCGRDWVGLVRREFWDE